MQPGERVVITLPYSEVCMSMQVAGKRMGVELLAREHGGAAAQLYTPDGAAFSAPILAGEAGLFQDDRGFYFHPEG